MAFLKLVKKSKILPAETGKHSVHFLNVYYKNEQSLFPYMLFASAAVIGTLLGLFIYKTFFCAVPEDKLSQLIDIELVSQSDFKNTKNLLPATIPKPSLARRTSPVKPSKGKLFADPVFVIRAGGRQNTQNQEEQSQNDKEASSPAQPPDDNSLTGRYVPLRVPFSQVYRPLSSESRSSKKSEKADVLVDMQEVKPPELLEVKENEGDNGYNYWQDGGKSTKGTGISSSLASYLRDLHKKLKHAWVPPSGTVHHIKVVFRLDKNGNLVSSRLIQSSEDKLADQSAFNAIKNSAPFGKLPSDYVHQFLDLAYTFNYTTDELREIDHEIEEQ